MRTTVTPVNRAYQRKLKTQIHKRNTQNTKYNGHSIPTSKTENGIYWLHVMELLFIIFKK